MALRLAVVVSQAPGLGGYAVGQPPLDGGRERLGHRLFGDVYPPGLAVDRADHGQSRRLVHPPAVR